MRRKFIVIYGINNLGKTTQAKLLVDYLNSKKFKAEYLKIPVYSVEPSGTYLNKLLRAEKQTVSEDELQMWFAINRIQYLPTLMKKLEDTIIVAEDYVGTSLAWGSVKGADIEWLKQINKPLPSEDLAILFNGKPFATGVEKRHIHEQNPELVESVRLRHLELARQFGWHIINSNQTPSKVHRDVVKIVNEFIRI